MAEAASLPQNSSQTTAIAPTLPFGDINLVVVTDVHSWVAGHGDNEGVNNLDVSYGDVVSFVEQIREHCKDEKRDVWFVQNGDWIDGTGLSMRENATALIDVLKQMPFDVLNTGNHDLYSGSVISETLKKGGFLDHWGPRHLSSNVYMNSTSTTKSETMSNRYHVLEGKHSTVLVFGFIYDLLDPSDLVFVQPVEEAVQESWFRDVLLDSSIGYDAILVMLHAGLDDPSVEILISAIRRIVADQDMPIQFVAGHTHMRRDGIADSRSTIVESGRYLDTVGWVTFPTIGTVKNVTQSTRHLQKSNFTVQNESMRPPKDFNSTITNDELDAATDLFRHVFLDANRKTLREALGIASSTEDVYEGDDDVFQTMKGRQVAKYIQNTRESLGLARHIGCAPHDYLLNQSMVRGDSLWKLYRDAVGPYTLETVQLVNDNNVDIPRALLLSQDSWRYGLYGGDHLTYDDVIAVSPFNEPIYRVAVMPCSSIENLEYDMNNNGEERYLSTLPAWILSAEELDMDAKDCELYVNHFGLSRVQATMQKLVTAKPIEWNPIESNLTTTSIWISFVKDNWKCQGDMSDNNGGLLSFGGMQFDNDQMGLIVVTLIASLVLLLCTFVIKCCRCCRRRNNANHGYDGVMLDTSVVAADSLDDDDGDEPPVRIV